MLCQGKLVKNKHSDRELCHDQQGAGDTKLWSDSIQKYLFTYLDQKDKLTAECRKLTSD